MPSLLLGTLTLAFSIRYLEIILINMSISILEAAKHLGKQSGWSLSNLKMQKILYIAHMHHLGNFNSPLVQGLFEAWDYGPVHPDLYHRAKVFGADPVGNIFRSFENLEGSGSEKRILDAAAKQLAGISSAQLIATTHREGGAWAKHYVPGVRGIEIPNEDILEEYREFRSKKNAGQRK